MKVSVATTTAVAPGGQFVRGQFVLGARALPGNPCDGHTLAAQIAQTERITGVTVERAYVDRGYRGHDKARVVLSGQTRGVTPTIRHEMRRRNAIEPAIGHAKSDGPLGRNFLLGPEGDAVNVVLAAAGQNLRLLRARLAWLRALSLGLLTAVQQNPTAPPPRLTAT